jgi:hypothetical protein
MRELEDSLRDLLDHDAQDYDPASRDRILGAITQAGRQRVTRARVWGGVVAAGVVTASVVVGVTVIARDGGADGQPPPPRTSEIADPGPEANAMREVGLHGAAISVPASWLTTDAVCDVPSESFVYYDSDIRNGARCPAQGDEGRVLPWVSVGIGDTDSAVGRDLTRHLKQSGAPVGGLAVVESAASCDEPRIITCTQSFAVPELGTFFRVTAQSEQGALATVQRLRDSLRLLPQGTTTVPFTPNGTLDARIADLEAAGLTVELVETLDGSAPGVFLGADPDLGTAVAEHSTVTLTVSGKPSTFPEEPTADGSASLDVACTPDGIVVSGSTVTATAEGVVVNVSSTMPTSTYLTFSGAHWGSGDPIPNQDEVWTLPIPPGDLELSCMPSGAPDPTSSANVTITDPDHHWRTATLDDFGCNWGGQPSWKYGPASGSSAEQAVDKLLSEFAQEGPAMTADPVEIGYVAAPTQTWIASRSTGPYLTIDVTQTGSSFSAMPDYLC